MYVHTSCDLNENWSTSRHSTAHAVALRCTALRCSVTWAELGVNILLLYIVLCTSYVRNLALRCAAELTWVLFMYFSLYCMVLCNPSDTWYLEVRVVGTISHSFDCFIVQIWVPIWFLVTLLIVFGLLILNLFWQRQSRPVLALFLLRTDIWRSLSSLFSTIFEQKHTITAGYLILDSVWKWSWVCLLKKMKTTKEGKGRTAAGFLK